MDLLIIDDDELTNFLMREILEDCNYILKYKMVTSGWDGLDWLEERELHEFPDLILLDLRMPEMDGFQFIELFEEKFPKASANTKIVVVSTSALPKDIQKAMSYTSVTRYINKPLTSEKLEELIKQMV